MMLVPALHRECRDDAGIDSISIQARVIQCPTNQIVISEIVYEKSFFFCNIHDAFDSSIIL